MTTSRLRYLLNLLPIIVTLIAYASMVRTQRVSELPLSGLPLVQTVGWLLLAFAAYIGILISVERSGALPAKWLWGLAICFRLMFLFSTPALSDDVYRYLWDGYLANQGVSPYAYPIDSPALDHLDIPLRHLANHSWMASPYLPASQLLFWVVTIAFPLRPIVMQIAMILFDLGTAVLLVKLLDLASVPRRRVFIYLLNPLVIVEVASNAHVDAWMLLLTLMAIYLTLVKPTRLMQFFGPVFLALATLTKILPVLLLPVLFWRWSWRQRLLFGLFTIGLLIPYGLQSGWGLTGDLNGTGLFGALRIYSAQWNFNSGLFHWLERLLGAPGYGSPSPLAKNIVMGIMVLVMLIILFLARRQQHPRDLLRLMAVPYMGYVLLTPTFHPWYILILLSFIPFLSPASGESPGRWLSVVPWLYLSAALTLSYITYFDRLNPAELEWVRQIEWIPTLLLALIASSYLFAEQGIARKEAAM